MSFEILFLMNKNYTANNYNLFKVDINRNEQSCAAHIVYRQLSTILNNIVDPESGVTMLNVGSTTLFNF